VTVCDTSIWIDYFNGVESALTDKLDELLHFGQVVILDIILLEILQGFRSDKEYKIARELLSALPIEQALDSNAALDAAENYRILRKKGISIRTSVDLIIATWCIKNNVPILHNDRDYNLIGTELPLMNSLY